MPDRETRGDRMRNGRDRLQAAGIDSPALEAELLMREALRAPGGPLRTKAWLLPRLGHTLDEDEGRRFEALLARRLAREPNAYITGVREFCGLEFEVTPDVLIPRPETELLVSTAHDWASGSGGHWTALPPTPQSRLFLRNRPRKAGPMRVADVGTGSGAIAIALAGRLPAATFTATDISLAALAVARRNAERHGLEGRIAFRHGHLLEPFDAYVDLIVANLPYVPESDWRNLDPEVRDHEPALALRGDDDGLDPIRALLHQAPRYLHPGGALCLEFGAGQRHALVEAVNARLPDAEIDVFDDFAGIPRVLVASLPQP